MATSTKPKKKYKPKLIRAPSVVAQLNSFSVFEAALKNILNTGTVQTTNGGIAIYRDSLGQEQSFCSALKVYSRVIEIYAIRHKVAVNITPLEVLRCSLSELKVIDEQEVEEAVKALDACKKIISLINPTELFDIFNTIRIELSMPN